MTDHLPTPEASSRIEYVLIRTAPNGSRFNVGPTRQTTQAAWDDRIIPVPPEWGDPKWEVLRRTIEISEWEPLNLRIAKEQQ